MRFLAALWVTAAACGEPPGEPPPEQKSEPEALPQSGWVSEGTRAMAARLSGFEDATDFTQRISALDATPIPAGFEDGLLHRIQRAFFLLQAGRHDEAADEIARIYATVDRDPRRVPLEFKRDARDLLAAAALWGTIRDACLASTDACLFPFDPEAFPPATEPRLRAALALYETMLREDGTNVMNAWLLNVANMTLGRYPDSVPARWRLPPGAFESEYDIGRFRERAAELGVDMIGHAGGAVLEDFDLDGDLDLLISSRALRDSIRYFENARGTFVERTTEAGLTGLIGGLNLLQADYDNDGDSDVFVLRGAWTQQGQPNSLLRNEGGGRFADVTEDAGVFSVHPTQSAAWGDYDNDGWLDLIVGNEAEMWSDPPREHATELYRNRGDGTFAEVAAEAGLDLLGFVKAVQWGDYDNDGRLDLYVSRFQEPNQLFHNEGADEQGAWHFRDVTAAAGVDAPISSLPAWFFDYDNDGWLDILALSFRVQPEDIILGFMGIRETAETPRLYRNRGDGTFENVTSVAGLDKVAYVMGSNFGDLDNDGWLDFYLGTGDPDVRTITPNRMFRNDGRGSFEEVTYSGGFGHVGKGHAVAFGDIDFDGDQDLYVVLGGAMQGDIARNALWENPGHGNRWITLRLHGAQSNRSAIGTRIRVSIDTPAGPRDVYAVVGSGGSFGGSSLQQEIGLADATAIREIEVRWHGSGRVDSFPGVALDRVYAVSEGTDELESLATTVVPLRRAEAP